MKLMFRAAVALIVTASLPAFADDVPQNVTFHKDVESILQENCQTCHRAAGTNLSGMIAPMSLVTYKEVRPWAKSIAQAVESKKMPPWLATKASHGVFRNERTLNDVEIATLVKWVETGAKRGNAADAPAPMEFAETGWNFGTPDLVIDFPEPFFVEDGVQDLYKNITVKLSDADLPADKWIKAIEFKMGSEVVHHMIGYASVPGEPGVRTARGMLGGNAPGTDQDNFPEGYGILLKKGSEVTFALHYHKESGAGTGVWDSSQIGILFHTKPVTHPVTNMNIQHGNFEIPPKHGEWHVGASRLFREDTHLLALMPHMHLRGKYAKYTAYYPDGTVEELLEVPVYDFNWQTSYKYAQNKLLPAGTRLEMQFQYDNSEESSDYRGIDPERKIRFGGPTTDEMDLAWITVAPAAPVGTD